MKKPLKYIAEPNHVREVSLVGTADLPYWKRWLEKEDLIPTESDGKAQLLIMAVAMSYMGIKFQELSFSVFVSDRNEGGRTDGMFLVHAFNSSRLFAYCERVSFSTPYYHGKVSVSANVPASIQLVDHGTFIFGAQMHTGTGVPARQPSRGDGGLGRSYLLAWDQTGRRSYGETVLCAHSRPWASVSVPAIQGHIGNCVRKWDL